MKTRRTISNEILHELFYVNDGILYWKVDRGSMKVAGQPAGGMSNSGYMKTKVDGKMFLNHRIVYMLHHGYMPDFVDHIDGNTANNSIENLREATHRQNLYNQKLRSTNTSGVKGVSLDKRYKKWIASIRISGKLITIGRYDSLGEAKSAIEKSRALHHGSFARHQ